MSTSICTSGGLVCLLTWVLNFTKCVNWRFCFNDFQLLFNRFSPNRVISIHLPHFLLDVGRTVREGQWTVETEGVRVEDGSKDRKDRRTPRE